MGARPLRVVSKLALPLLSQDVAVTPFLAFCALALIAADLRYRRNLLLLGAAVLIYYALLFFLEVKP